MVFIHSLERNFPHPNYFFPHINEKILKLGINEKNVPLYLFSSTFLESLFYYNNKGRQFKIAHSVNAISIETISDLLPILIGGPQKPKPEETIACSCLFFL